MLLLERAPELRVAGAGLTVQVNAMRALDRLGLADSVAAAGARIRAARVERAGGRLLQLLDLEEVQLRYGQPVIAIHRGALSAVLSAELPDGALSFDAGVAEVEEIPDGVKVRLEDGREVEGAALVGADGIHSRVRAWLVGEAPTRYAGYTCWRGIAPVAPFEDVAVERWGAGSRFGIVPIGEGRTYWFAVVDAPEGGSDAQDPRPELLLRFRDYAEPVGALIEATPAADILRNDIVDRPAIEGWSRGRVTLLGDAAHAMTPNLGQGACQAIEDALFLAAALGERPADPVQAFAAYAMARNGRTAAMVRRSYRIGAMAQWSNPLAVGLRDLLTWLTPAATMRSMSAPIFGHPLPELR